MKLCVHELQVIKKNPWLNVSLSQAIEGSIVQPFKPLSGAGFPSRSVIISKGLYLVASTRGSLKQVLIPLLQTSRAPIFLIIFFFSFFLVVCALMGICVVHWSLFGHSALALRSPRGHTVLQHDRVHKGNSREIKNQGKTAVLMFPFYTVSYFKW